jgi:hypothetical protein
LAYKETFTIRESVPHVREVAKEESGSHDEYKIPQDKTFKVKNGGRLP